MWSPVQQRIVTVIALGLLTCLTIRLATHRTFIPVPQPPTGLRAADLADKIDPNTARVEEIAAIPNVGRSLAQALVDYRAARLSERPGQPVFAEPKDLLRVKGIGAARMDSMGTYMVFPGKRDVTSRPTSRPR